MPMDGSSEYKRTPFPFDMRHSLRRIDLPGSSMWIDRNLINGIDNFPTILRSWYFYHCMCTSAPKNSLTNWLRYCQHEFIYGMKYLRYRQNEDRHNATLIYCQVWAHYKEYNKGDITWCKWWYDVCAGPPYSSTMNACLPSSRTFKLFQMK